MSDIVKLSTQEMKICKLIAIARMKESRKAEIYDRSASELMRGRGGIQWDLLGAYGEMALAKWLDIKYTADVNSFHSIRDVGPFEVRTAGQDHYNLILRNSDKEIGDKPFVLVVQKSVGIFRVVGWIYGKHGFKKEYMNSFGLEYRDPAYKIPQSQLIKSFDRFASELEKFEYPFKIILPGVVRKYRYESCEV